MLMILKRYNKIDRPEVPTSGRRKWKAVPSMNDQNRPNEGQDMEGWLSSCRFIIREMVQ